MSAPIERWTETDYPLKELTGKVIGAAIEVHRVLGPGYVESIYENALVHELQKSGLKVRQQVTVTVIYDGVVVGEHRIDLLVEEAVVLELKAIEELAPRHHAQAKSTLKAAKLQVALLMNFNVARMADGIKRVVLTQS